MVHNRKIRLTEEQVLDVIDSLIENLTGSKDRILSTDVFRTALSNAVITEGLIKTYSYSDTRKVLLTNDILKYGIKISPIYFFKQTNSSGDKPIQIYLNFTKGLESVSEEYFNRVIKLMDICGWYFAGTLGHGNELGYDRLLRLDSPFTCVFEPKFDVLLSNDDIPNELYHVTPKRLVEKILKKGIVPKSGNMFTNHPERVYLFMQDPSDMVDEIAHTFNLGKDIDEEYVVIEVEYDKIRNGNRFYIDPNSNYINACFTLEPIPPFALRIKEG